jgi:HAD superfamily hydrolase (TIGR01509 family)
MALKAVLFDFNGIIINDEPIHKELIEQLLIEENMRPKAEEYWSVCLGRSDRACLKELLHRRGRLVNEDYLDQLVERKAAAYEDKLEHLDKLPTYPALPDLLFQLRAAKLPLAVVSGALRREVEMVLTRTQMRQYFSVIVGGDDVKASKPDPEGYLLAVERLNQQMPELDLRPEDCLAIEDSYQGMAAAKQAGIPVAGVAHTHPFHMVQRRATWVVDYLNELDLDWIRRHYEPQESLPSSVEV